MTAFRLKVLEAIQQNPGSGVINVCDYLGNWEAIDILNVDRAMNWLRQRGWIDSNQCITEEAEKFLARQEQPK